MRFLPVVLAVAALCLPAAAQDQDIASHFASDTLFYAEADAGALVEGLPQLDLAKLLGDEKFRKFLKPTLEKLEVDLEKPVEDLLSRLPIRQFLKGRVAFGVQGFSVRVPGRNKVFRFSARHPIDATFLTEMFGAGMVAGLKGARADNIPVHVALDFVAVAEPGPALQELVKKELGRDHARLQVTEVRIGERAVKRFRYQPERIEENFFYAQEFFADLSGDRWILASSPEAFTEAAAGGPRANLAAQPAFRAVRARMTSGRPVAFAFADVAQAARIWRNFLPPIAAELLDKTGVDSIVGAGLGVSITDGGVRESLGVVLDGNPKGIWTLLDALPGGLAALEVAPPEALAVIGAKFDAKILVERVKTLAADLAPGSEAFISPMLAQALAGSGLSLEENVLPAFGDEIALIMLPPEGFGIFPQTVIGLDVDDELQFRNLLAQAQAAAAQAGDALRIQEIDIVEAKPAADGQPATPALRGWQVLAAIPLAPPTFTVHKGHFFGATGKPLLAKVCTEWGAEGAKTLGADDPNFKKVLGALNGGRGDDLVVLAYMDLKKMAPMILQTLQMSIMASPELQEWLDFGNMPSGDDIAKHVSGLALGLRKDKHGLVVDSFSQTGMLGPALGLALVQQARFEREMARDLDEMRTLQELAQSPDAPFFGIQSLSTDGQSGITILGTFENGPARKAGIQNADVIVAINRLPTPGLMDLRRATLQHKPGDTVKVTIQRGGERIDVDLTLVRRGDFFPGTTDDK